MNIEKRWRYVTLINELNIKLSIVTAYQSKILTTANGIVYDQDMLPRYFLCATKIRILEEIKLRITITKFVGDKSMNKNTVSSDKESRKRPIFFYVEEKEIYMLH